jgi:hypothetical protein
VVSPAKLAMNAAGDGLAVWPQESATQVDDIWATHFDEGTSTWEGAFKVNTGSFDVGLLRAALSDDGNAVVAWEEATGGLGSHIFASFYDGASGNWSPTVQLTDDGLSHSNLELVFDEAGRVHAVWIGFTPIGAFVDYFVAARSFDPGAGSWGQPSSLELTEDFARWLTLGLDGQGRPTAAWSGQGTDNTHAIHMRRLEPGSGTWGDVELIATPMDLDVTHLKFAPGVEGEEWLMYVGVASGVAAKDLNVRRRLAGSSTWEDAVIVDEAGFPPETPAMAIDGLGNAFFAWSQNDAFDYFPILARRFARGSGTWGEIELMADNPELDSQPGFKLGADDQGDAVLVYQIAPSEDVDEFSARHFDAGCGEWAEPIVIDALDTDADAPSIAVDGAGRALVVWDQADDQDQDNIWANRFE